jgi:murein DD-endopeptidase MepM/ murein hydrolase activator NlpD
MRSLILLLIVNISTLFSAISIDSRWSSGTTFTEYLEENNISLTLIENIEAEDKKFLSEIQGQTKIFELYSNSGKLLQSLIPIGREMQIQISIDELNNEYQFDIIPIIYGRRELEAVIPITTNPHYDIIKNTHNKKLATTIDKLFRYRVNCKKLQKGDKIAIIYMQRERLNRPFLAPEVKAIAIKSRNRVKFIFVDKDGVAYNDIYRDVSYVEKGKKKEKCIVKVFKQKFIMPLRNVRITSTFSYKRWHPILHRYRPHLGTDFGARRGTPLLAVANGKVIYAGWMGGYGKVVKIKHAGGYVSLYAHQSRIRVRRGQRVKIGSVIGYVGSTGRSTGPHLHFGLYKNHRAVNPMRVINRKSISRSKIITKIIDIVKTKKVLIKGAKESKKRLLEILAKPPVIFDWDNAKNNFMYIKDKPKSN